MIINRDYTFKTCIEDFLELGKAQLTFGLDEQNGLYKSGSDSYALKYDILQRDGFSPIYTLKLSKED